MNFEEHSAKPLLTEHGLQIVRGILINSSKATQYAQGMSKAVICLHRWRHRQLLQLCLLKNTLEQAAPKSSPPQCK